MKEKTRYWLASGVPGPIEELLLDWVDVNVKAAISSWWQNDGTGFASDEGPAATVEVENGRFIFRFFGPEKPCIDGDESEQPDVHMVDHDVMELLSDYCTEYPGVDAHARAKELRKLAGDIARLADRLEAAERA